MHRSMGCLWAIVVLACLACSVHAECAAGYVCVSTTPKLSDKECLVLNCEGPGVNATCACVLAPTLVPPHHTPTKIPINPTSAPSGTPTPKPTPYPPGPLRPTTPSPTPTPTPTPPPTPVPTKTPSNTSTNDEGGDQKSSIGCQKLIEAFPRGGCHDPSLNETEIGILVQRACCGVRGVLVPSECKTTSNAPTTKPTQNPVTEKTQTGLSFKGNVKLLSGKQALILIIGGISGVCVIAFFLYSVNPARNGCFNIPVQVVKKEKSKRKQKKMKKQAKKEEEAKQLDEIVTTTEEGELEMEEIEAASVDEAV